MKQSESEHIVKEDPEELFSDIDELIKGKPRLRPMSHGRVQLEKAPNAVQFIESPLYLSGPSLHYPQFEVVRDYFELMCPICNDTARIRSANDIPREDQILFEYDICPQCGMSKNSFREEFNYYNELVGVVGMRGGKSVLVACMASYALHEILCIDNYQESLGLVRSQEIDGAFVAASSEQASETIYGHFRGFYDESPWFQNYKKALMDLEIADPSLRRGDLYWETDRSIHFKEKHIRIKSLTSNSGSIAGKTRVFAVIDEISRMDAGESKRSATEVYRVLKRSLLTIKAAVDAIRQDGNYSIPDAKMFCISSPLYQDDKAMQLLKTAAENKKMFAFHRTTWEFNPEIPREALAEEFATDPLGAERDYAANPPGAENPFIRNPDLVEISIDRNRANIFRYRDDFFEKEVQGIVFKYIKVILEQVDYRNLNDYVIHCDPGQNNDSFCIAMGHKDAGGVVVIDGAIEARPIPKNNVQRLEPREVHFPSMVELIVKLNNILSLKALSYDRWNSTDQIQRLRDEKILAFQKNISREDHVRFLSGLEAAKVSFPKRENDFIDPKVHRNMPCAKALWELKKLNDNGVIVNHPPNGSNDMIQCYVGVHRLLTSPESVMSANEMRKQELTKRGFRSFYGKKLGSVVRLPVKGRRRQ